MKGTNLERKFIKSIANGELKNKQKRFKLVDFLRTERKEREAFILNDKAKKSMDLDGKDGYFDKERFQKKNQNSEDSRHNGEHSKGFVSDFQNGATSKECFCHICGKLGNHVLSVDGKGKHCIQYVACKIFLSLKPRERSKLLYKKRLCCKCLTPGTKWDSDHFCNKSYTCNQT